MMRSPKVEEVDEAQLRLKHSIGILKRGITFVEEVDEAQLRLKLVVSPPVGAVPVCGRGG